MSVQAYSVSEVNREKMVTTQSHLESILAVSDHPKKSEEIQKLFLEAQEIFCNKMGSQLDTLWTGEKDSPLAFDGWEWQGASQNELDFVKKILMKEREESSLDKIVRLTQGKKRLEEELEDLSGHRVRIQYIRNNIEKYDDYPPKEKRIISVYNQRVKVAEELVQKNKLYSSVTDGKNIGFEEMCLIDQCMEISYSMGQLSGFDYLYNRYLKKLKTKDENFEL